MKILIVGGSGFVGSNLVRYLNKKHDIVATFNSCHKNRHSAAQWMNIRANQQLSIAYAMESANPDVVINAAGYKDVVGCESSPLTAYDNNVSITATLADACRTFKKRFVHISTDLVFDGYAAPYTELADPSPMNVYGFSKLAAENISQICQDTIIIRTGGLYGHGHPLLGKAFTELSGRNKMFGFQDAFNTPTFLGNLAASIDRLLAYDSGVYHIADKTTASRYDLLRTYSEVFGFNGDLIEPTNAPPQLLLPPDVSLQSVFPNPGATTLTEGLTRYKEELLCESH